MSEQTSETRRRFPLAIILWVIVGGALVYGISQTVIKASALF